MKEEFQKLIQDARNEYSDRDLALMFQVSTKTISRWASGETQPYPAKEIQALHYLTDYDETFKIIMNLPFATRRGLIRKYEGELARIGSSKRADILSSIISKLKAATPEMEF